MFIPDPDYFPSLIQDPAVKKAPDPGSGLQHWLKILGTQYLFENLGWLRTKEASAFISGNLVPTEIISRGEDEKKNFKLKFACSVNEKEISG
jgi:hypothetical protein